MKAWVFQGKGRFQLADLPTPEIKDDEVLLKIKGLGICGTDLHIYNGGMKVPENIVLGHEFSGIVEKVGSRVCHCQVGDSVVGEHVIPCKECHYCLRGRPNLCLNAQVIGIHRNGALAEYLALPADLVYTIPKSLSFAEAALIEPLSIAVYAVRESGFLLNKVVAVVGQGPIGLFIDQVLKTAGAHVIGMDVRDEPLAFARERNWIDHSFNPHKDDLSALIKLHTVDGFDKVFEVVGVEATAEASIQMARRDGDVFFLGVFQTPAKLDLMQIVKKELNVHGSWTCAFSFADAIDLVTHNKVELKSLITHTYDFQEMPQAFMEAGQYKGNRIKTVIRFS